MDDQRMVRVRHYEVDPMNGPGQMVTASFARSREPFVVFCSDSDCEHSIDRLSAIPFWSEDCPEKLELLRCPECGSPVKRPRRD